MHIEIKLNLSAARTTTQLYINSLYTQPVNNTYII